MDNTILLISAIAVIALAGILLINKKSNISEEQKRKNYVEYKKAKKDFDRIVEKMKKE